MADERADEPEHRADLVERVVGGVEWLASRGLLLAAFFYLFAFLYVTVSRIAYPYELEWMEGLSVDSVRRVLAGLPLYGEPGVEYVPGVYTPLYFYVSAPLYALFGGGFLPLRLVSLAGSLGVLALVFLFVRKETGDTSAAVVSGGLFMATFEQCGSWFDIARTDSLFVFLALLSLYLVRFKKSTLRWALVAAGAMLLAFLAKQTVVAVAASLVACVAVRGGIRRAVVVGLALATAVGAVTLGLHLASDGWSTWFLFEMPSQHDLRRAAFREFWTLDLGVLAAAVAVALFYVMDRLRRRQLRDLLFYLLLAAGPLVTSWLSRLHGGGYRNVLIPAFAVVSILFGLGLHASRTFFEDLDELRRKLLACLVSLLCILQLFHLRYDIPRQVPTEGDRRAGDALVARLERVDGDVLMMWHGYLPVLAGSESYSLGMSLSDVQRAQDDDVRDALVAEIDDAIRDQRFGAIVVDNTSGFFEGRFQRAMDECYGPGERLFDDERVFWPVTGFRTRPEQIRLPRRSPWCGPDRHLAPPRRRRVPSEPRVRLP